MGTRSIVNDRGRIGVHEVEANWYWPETAVVELDAVRITHVCVCVSVPSCVCMRASGYNTMGVQVVVCVVFCVCVHGRRVCVGFSGLRRSGEARDRM